MITGQEPDRDAASDAGVPSDEPLSHAERLELIRLRAEAKKDQDAIRGSRLQIDLAKKVAAWFAKDRQQFFCHRGLGIFG